MGIQNDFCGVVSTKGLGGRNDCCHDKSEDLTIDCDDVHQPRGKAIDSLIEFSADEDAWLE